MKIAMVTPYALPEKGACSIRVESFKNYFDENGHKVMIFAPMRGGIKVGNNGIIRYKSLKDLIWLLYKGEFDAVIGTSPPILHDFFALIVCRYRMVPFILDSKDLFTYTLSKLNLISTKSIKFKIYNLIEKLTHKYANKILVLNPYIKDWIIESYGINKDKFILAMNGVDTKIIKRDENEGKRIRENVGIPIHVPLIIYAGSLGDEKPEIFLKTSAKEIVDKYNCHILFIIASDETSFAIRLYNEILSIVKTLGIENNFHILKNIDYGNMYKYLSAADIGISTWADFEYPVLPVKIFDYLGCELPIVAKSLESNKEMEDFFKKYDVGYFTTNWHDFKEKLKKALDDLENFKKKGKYGKKVVEENYTREKTNKIVLDELLKLQN